MCGVNERSGIEGGDVVFRERVDIEEVAKD